MAVGAIAAVVGTAFAIAATSYQMANMPGQPDYSGLGNAQAEGVRAQAEVLPTLRQYQRAAQIGGEAVKWGYHVQDAGKLRASLQGQIDAAQKAWDAAKAAGAGKVRGNGLLGIPDYQGQIAKLQEQMGNLPASGTAYTDANGNVVAKGQAMVSFAGMGQAEVQARIASEMAKVQLDLSQKYGTQFAQQAKEQLALADPEGTAAREKLYQMIEQQNQETPDRPVAELLDRQIGQQLSSGARLDPAMRDLLDQEVARSQAARGQDAGANTQQFATPLETGFEGQQRQRAGNQKALSWLTSGSTPEDVQYRRQQQNLANLGSFVQGTTPEAQFQNLSGAQQGTTPFYPGQPMAQVGSNAGQTAAGYETAGYLKNLQYQQSQANPWMAGISTILQGLGAAGAGGWKPLQPGAGGA